MSQRGVLQRSGKEGERLKKRLEKGLEKRDCHRLHTHNIVHVLASELHCTRCKPGNPDVKNRMPITQPYDVV